MRVLKQDRAYHAVSTAPRLVEKTLTIADFLHEVQREIYTPAQLEKLQMIVRNGQDYRSIDDIVLYQDGLALVYGAGKEMFLSKAECAFVKAQVTVLQ